MTKLSINLLPPEFALSKKKQHRQLIIANSSIMALVFVIIVTGTTIALRLSQKTDIQKSEQDLNNIQQQISRFSEQETLVRIFKTRIDKIVNIQKSYTDKPLTFSLDPQALPPAVSIIASNTDKSGLVRIDGETFDPRALDTFFDNLFKLHQDQNQIGKVKVESLTKSKSGAIRFGVSFIYSAAVKVPKPAVVPLPASTKTSKS